MEINCRLCIALRPACKHMVKHTHKKKDRDVHCNSVARTLSPPLVLTGYVNFVIPSVVFDWLWNYASTGPESSPMQNSDAVPRCSVTSSITCVEEIIYHFTSCRTTEKKIR